MNPVTQVPSLFNEDSEDASEEMLTPYETLVLSAKFSVIWFVANALYNASLACTTVSSTNILSSTSGIFTLIVSRFILSDPISIQKAFAVLCCFAGVVVVTGSDSSGSTASTGPCNKPELGDALSLGSAISYALYTVLLKKVVGTEGRISMLLFFGLIGLINAVAILPILGAAHLTGLETFHMPSSKDMGLLTLNGLIGTVLSDYLWARSVLLLSPLISTLGLSLTIPSSMLAQALLFDDQFSPGYVIGAALTFMGFLMVNLDGGDDDSASVDVVPAAISSLLVVPPSPMNTGAEVDDLDGLMKEALGEIDDLGDIEETNHLVGPESELQLCQCGNGLMEDAVFCRKCGKRRPQDPSRGRELQHGTLQYDSMVTTTEEWGPQQDQGHYQL